MDFSRDERATYKVLGLYGLLWVAAILAAVLLSDKATLSGVLWGAFGLPFGAPYLLLPSIFMIPMGLLAPKAKPLVAIGALGVLFWVGLATALAESFSV